MLGSNAVVSVARPLRRSELAVDLRDIADRLDRMVGAEPSPLATPVEVLATRSDLVGSIAVAEVLAERDWPAAEPRVDDGRWLADHVAHRMESSARWLERMLADPSKGRSPLPRPERVHEVLAREAARPGRPADWLAALAIDLGRPWTHRALAGMRTIRREAGRLRAEASPELASLGPGAARLERLDAALRRGLAGAQADTDQAFAHRFGAAYAALITRLAESEPSLATLEHFHRAGAAAHLRADLDAALRAVLREERALLDHLVRACVAAARADAARATETPSESMPPDGEGTPS